MADWRDDLKAHLDSYFEKKLKIGKALSECLGSLVVSPYNITGIF